MLSLKVLLLYIWVEKIKSGGIYNTVKGILKVFKNSEKLYGGILKRTVREISLKGGT